MELTFITGNTGKFEQIQEMLPAGVSFVQTDFDIPEIQTTSLAVISADKARQAFEKLGKPLIVEDSGIYFDAYTEFPGALTKFIYQSLGIEGIETLFHDVVNKKAHFQCVISYMDETLDAPLQFIGEGYGHLSFDLVGKLEEDARLPYDLIFIPESMEEPVITDMKRWKSSKDNHRSSAARKLAEWLAKN